MIITSRSTKAEILAAYEALKIQQQAETVTWPLLSNTARVIAEEAGLLAKDTYKLAAITTQWFLRTLDELKQPVIHFRRS